MTGDVKIDNPPKINKLADAHELRSFGRRRGRKLRARQTQHVEQLLPRLSLDLAQPTPRPLTEIFDSRVSDVWLEIGFGGGEHLLWQAAHNPQIGIIGCEPFLDGIVKVLDGVEANNLENIRLHADDARDVLRCLPDGSLGRVFILFPDPWPKKQHHKRRLVNVALLRQLARVMRPGGVLRLGTDIGDYAADMLAAVNDSGMFNWLARHCGDWRIRPSDWPQTRYEQKADREGRSSYYLCFERR